MPFQDWTNPLFLSYFEEDEEHKKGQSLYQDWPLKLNIKVKKDLAFNCHLHPQW